MYCIPLGGDVPAVHPVQGAAVTTVIAQNVQATSTSGAQVQEAHR